MIMEASGNVRVNVGCGASPTTGYVNYDNSLGVILARHKIVVTVMRWGRLLSEAQLKLIEQATEGNVRWADASKKIPLADHSVAVLYSSHMLEHLDRYQAKRFLVEAYRVLRPGGILRLVVPDLERLAKRYCVDGDADKFVQSTLLWRQDQQRLNERLRYLLVGDRAHKWMYDEMSAKKLIESIGFASVRGLGPGITSVVEPGALDLWERSEESVYVEAMRP